MYFSLNEMHLVIYYPRNDSQASRALQKEVKKSRSVVLNKIMTLLEVNVSLSLIWLVPSRLENIYP